MINFKATNRRVSFLTVTFILIFFFCFDLCFLEGSPPKRFPISKEGKWGFINETGNIIIPPRFDFAYGFSEGLARVNMGGKKTIGGKWGYIDEEGKLVIPFLFAEAKDFSCGLACVRMGQNEKFERYCFINKEGRIVISPQFLVADSFYEDMASVTFDYCKWGYIDITGKLIIKPQFSNIFSDSEDITNNLNSRFSEGLALAVSGTTKIDHTGFIDKKGSYVFKLPISQGSFFSEGLAPVAVNWKWGYVNKKGSFAIKPKFKSVGKFKDGLAPVQEDELMGFIDKEGNWKIKPRYEPTPEISVFSEGLAPVKLKSHEGYGYIDRTGSMVIKPRSEFIYVEPFSNGVARVIVAFARIDSMHKIIKRFGYINRKGNYIWKPTE